MICHSIKRPKWNAYMQPSYITPPAYLISIYSSPLHWVDIKSISDVKTRIKAIKSRIFAGIMPRNYRHLYYSSIGRWHLFWCLYIAIWIVIYRMIVYMMLYNTSVFYYPALSHHQHKVWRHLWNNVEMGSYFTISTMIIWWATVEIITYSMMTRLRQFYSRFIMSANEATFMARRYQEWLYKIKSVDKDSSRGWLAWNIIKVTRKTTRRRYPMLPPKSKYARHMILVTKRGIFSAWKYAFSFSFQCRRSWWAFGIYGYINYKMHFQRVTRCTVSAA